MSGEEDEGEGEELSPRQIARQARNEAGDRSARLAHAILELGESAFERLQLDEDLLADMARARSITSHGARRREERLLAKILRKVDIAEVEARVAECLATELPDTRVFHAAETQRALLIEGGAPALDKFLAELGGLPRDRWAELVGKAQKEKATGRPKGAARALFREIMDVLKSTERGEP
jgi:ribosome-associated protein